MYPVVDKKGHRFSFPVISRIFRTNPEFVPFWKLFDFFWEKVVFKTYIFKYKYCEISQNNLIDLKPDFSLTVMWYNMWFNMCNIFLMIFLMTLGVTATRSRNSQPFCHYLNYDLQVRSTLYLNMKLRINNLEIQTVVATQSSGRCIKVNSEIGKSSWFQ